MTKKDIAILLAPIVMFLTVGAASLFVADLLHRRIESGDSHEKFEAFVQNVESGKWHLTTDRWLEGMRRQQATASAYLKVDMAVRELLLWLAWAALVGIFLQVAAVLHVRKRLRGVTSNGGRSEHAPAPGFWQC